MEGFWELRGTMEPKSHHETRKSYLSFLLFPERFADFSERVRERLTGRDNKLFHLLVCSSNNCDYWV